MLTYSNGCIVRLVIKFGHFTMHCPGIGSLHCGHMQADVSGEDGALLLHKKVGGTYMYM